MQTAWMLAAVFWPCCSSARLAQQGRSDDGVASGADVRGLPLHEALHVGVPLWLGLCLGLAPAGAWVAIAADVHGWGAITGLLPGRTEFLWAPTILPISIGVALWIAAFDINYARMDVESDREQAFIPSRPNLVRRPPRTTVQLSLLGLPALPSRTPWTASGSSVLPLRWHWPTSRRASNGTLRRFSNGAVSGVDAHRLGLLGCVGCRLLR